jgi:hypothetical protein
MEVSAQLHAPADFTPWESSQYPFGDGLRAVAERKLIISSGNRIRICFHVSLNLVFTVWAIETQQWVGLLQLWFPWYFSFLCSYISEVTFKQATIIILSLNQDLGTKFLNFLDQRWFSLIIINISIIKNWITNVTVVARDISLLFSVQKGSRTHTGLRAPAVLSQRIKWPGREADHSPPSSAEVNNAWSYISTPPYILMAWCFIK